MKKIKFLALILAFIAAFSFCLCACEPIPESGYEITLNPDLPYTIEVGDEIDYTQYFIVKDQNGNQITVTAEMLDLSEVDTSKPGIFGVTITIGNSKATATFAVTEKQGSPSSDDFSSVLANYADPSKWNFAVNFSCIDGSDTYKEYYEYLGYNVLNTYTANDGNAYTDYLGYNVSSDTYYFYADNGNGSYEKYAENTDDFEDNYYNLYLIDLSELGNFTFTAKGNTYSADKPADAGNAVICEYEGYEWTSLTVDIADGKITKVVGVMDDGYTEKYELAKQGSVNFKLPDASEDTTPSGTMNKQTYNPSTFDNETLHDKMLKNDMIGLPSTGDYHALVIPVQFSGDTITATQLDKLNKAFNGTAADTGWESVQSYYQKASYGKLNLTFDIQEKYSAKYTSTYYANYSENYVEDGHTYTRTGEEIILTEVLSYYETRLDLTKYDTNDDGAIDAVYLIYSAPVDYDEADFFWAYTTWYYGENKYDGLDAYYYFFAGFDFMDESTANDTSGYYDKIPGLKINAATFIHETGHLLGLDDYYDYDDTKGSNEGLGGADMMDYTVGDQNVYSKIMLGWLTPTIVNETQTLTINSSATSASAILIPLNFNNSYFCEYLLIDLYSAQGLNALHASVDNSYLYDGASYGVRIYHVSSSINNPYSDEYGSFTDYNNTYSSIPLIKLVEADGEKKFKSSGGYASQTDLWKAGSSLLSVFPSYTRNDGKKVNFDIKINSVSAASASITITFSN